ncbi:ABC transporter permease [Enemella dayhoffiae]|uniref:ABC transporter permease n=1 Tax=Enemella dayhoffiae TaxID=2016507 RepID=UPI001E5DA134|nr:ABC transporter permease [Enemella dayhoffiae]
MGRPEPSTGHFVAPANHRRRSTARILAPLLLGAAILLGWQLVTAVGAVPITLLPTPVAVAQRFGQDLAAGQLLAWTGTTIVEALLGSALAASIALPLAYLIAKVRLVETATAPYLAASQAIPAVAVAPLLVLWVGYGLLPIVLLCALLVFFPVVLATVLGVRGVDPELKEAAQLDGAAGWQLLRHIEGPLSQRAVLTGLRNGFTLSITGAVVGELVMGGNGLGMVLSVQASTADTTGLFSTLLMLCLLAIVIYLIMLLLESWTDPLRPTAARESQISVSTKENR